MCMTRSSLNYSHCRDDGSCYVFKMITESLLGQRTNLIPEHLMSHWDWYPRLIVPYVRRDVRKCLWRAAQWHTNVLSAQSGGIELYIWFRQRKPWDRQNPNLISRREYFWFYTWHLEVTLHIATNNSEVDGRQKRGTLGMSTTPGYVVYRSFRVIRSYSRTSVS